MGKPTGSLAGVVFVLLFLATSAFGDPTPATFDEYVGIAWYTSQGSDPSNAENVSLAVSNLNTDNRGSGSGSARATAVLPGTAETWLHLDGGTNPSGIGGTTFVQNRFEFMLAPLQVGEPELVEFHFSASGFVEVSSSATPGSTFSRLTTPFGQFEARNWDAYGWYNGRFEFEVGDVFQAWSDTPQLLTMYLYSHGQGSGTDYFFDSHTFLDPVVTLSGEWANRYEVVWSPGISPAAVPEPASICLVAIGLAGAATGIRKRRA